MAESALGFLLRNLREERGLSLREAAQLANMDHAYIYRLETGDKESPSDESLARLSRALKAPRREAEMLKYLVTHPSVDATLIAHVRSDPAVTFEEFTNVAGVVHRGTARPTWPQLIERVRRIMREENGG